MTKNWFFKPFIRVKGSCTSFGKEVYKPDKVQNAGEVTQRWSVTRGMDIVHHFRDISPQIDRIGSPLVPKFHIIWLCRIEISQVSEQFQQEMSATGVHFPWPRTTCVYGCVCPSIPFSKTTNIRYCKTKPKVEKRATPLLCVGTTLDYRCQVTTNQQRKSCRYRLNQCRTGKRMWLLLVTHYHFQVWFV